MSNDPTMAAKRGERAGMRSCQLCGHPAYRHGELRGEWVWQGEGEDRDLVEVKPAEYEPGVFHCRDCSCVTAEVAA